MTKQSANTEKSHIAHVYRIFPNEAHHHQLKRQFGCVRFVFNHFLWKNRQRYGDSKKYTSYNANAAALTQLKRTDDYHWLKNVHSQVLQQSLMNLNEAFKRYNAGLGGKPRFKRKGYWQSCRYPQGVKLDVEKGQTYLPKVGWVKTVFHRPLPDKPNIEMKSVTVKYSPAGEYTISCLFEHDPVEVEYTGSVLGVDVGLTHFATTSDGEKIENPRYLQKSLKKLKKLQRRLARKQTGSNGWHKARRKLARCHAKIHRQRQDFLHRLSYHWTHENQVVRMESLNITGMMQNRRLAQSIGSAGWGELKRQLTYKGKWYGCHIEEVPMFYPSTKLCHHCQHKNDNLTLSDREWQCHECGSVHDRDLNAALNIRDYPDSMYATTTGGSPGSHADGGG
jgi:putative transposase